MHRSVIEWKPADDPKVFKLNYIYYVMLRFKIHQHAVMSSYFTCSYVTMTEHYSYLPSFELAKYDIKY